MTNHTTTPAPHTATAVRSASLFDAIASEWIKLRTHRGVLITLLAGTVITIAAGVNSSSLNASSLNKGAVIPGQDPMSTIQFGMKFGLIAFAIAGALAISSEYNNGMIRTSLAAVPSRGRLLTAKVISFTTLALTAGLTASLTSYIIGRSILSDSGLQLSLGDPGVLRSLIGGGLFLATCGLLAFGLGALLRNAVAAVGSVFALFVSSMMASSAGYLPFQAGLKITAATTPNAWSGYLTLLTWAATAVAAAYLAMKHRDA
ncbi:ABC transporter permease [Streptomyces vinaceus]|uniref:ABC transporter permease n=1 Tax=Streptomyces vinaceus TaxID=1960 RepID=UPI0035E338EE